MAWNRGHPLTRLGQMREALGIDKSVDILDHVHSLPDKEQEEAHQKLQAIERKAMVEMQPRQGLSELMDVSSQSTYFEDNSNVDSL
jgi:hypothetical protein